jgi:hypothetical protein
MKRFHPDFVPLLDSFTLETLEKDSNPVFGLSADLTLNYLNPAWFTFAAENEGEPAISERFHLGTDIGVAMIGSARDYYLDIFQKILQTGEVWHHDYECSSPKKFRIYHQAVYPLYARRGLISVNSLVKEEPHDKNACSPIIAVYTQKNGFITQCSNCRRVQRASQSELWDWVPAYVAKMPDKCSHSFCPICFDYYYLCKYPQVR